MDRVNILQKKKNVRAYTAIKTKYMLNRSWFCSVCNYDYKLAGKWTHLKSKKHVKKSEKHIENFEN